MENQNLTYDEASAIHFAKNKYATPSKFNSSCIKTQNVEYSSLSNKNADSRSFLISQLKRDISILKEQNFDVHELNRQLSYREKQCEQITRNLYSAQERHLSTTSRQNDKIADLAAELENLNFQEKEFISEYSKLTINTGELAELRSEKDFEYSEIKKELADAISIREELEMNIIVDKKELSKVKTSKNQIQSRIEVVGLRLQEQTDKCSLIDEEYKELCSVIEHKDKELHKFNEKLEEIEDISNKIEILDRETFDDIDKLEQQVEDFNETKSEMLKNIDVLDHDQKDKTITLNRHSEDSTQQAKDYDEIDKHLKVRMMTRENKRTELNKIREGLEETKLKNEFQLSEINHYVTVIKAQEEKE